MTNSSVKNPISVLAIFALSIVLFSGAIVSVVHADDAQSFDGGGFDAQSFGGAVSAQSFGIGFDAQALAGNTFSAQSFSGNTYDAQSFGGNTYDAQSFGGNTYDAQAFGGNTYDAQAFGGGTIDPNAASIDTNASSIDMNASSIDTNASSIYSVGSTYDVYSVYSIPSYGYNYGTAALAYGVGYGLGYAGMTYPYYTYRTAPSYVSAPSNTSINAPTNTCTAPNTCNTTVDDRSVVNAPTYTQPAAVVVAPVSQAVPQYIAQAYVPYTYTNPSYVYTNPAPYYAPVNTSPYVALTQIPYTGFDLGPFGNALYWLGLLGVAAAGAYLIVYYLPGIFSGRGNAMAFAGMANGSKTVKSDKVTPPSVRNHLINTVAPIGDNPRSNLRTSANWGTSDMMRIIKSAHGTAPRIVISRS